MCQHKFQIIQQSGLLIKGKLTEINIYQCIKCKKLQIIDKENCKVISLDGRFGEEIDYRNEVNK